MTDLISRADAIAAVTPTGPMRNGPRRSKRMRGFVTKCTAAFGNTTLMSARCPSAPNPATAPRWTGCLPMLMRRAALVCAEYPVPIGCTKAAIELQSAILALIEQEGA